MKKFNLERALAGDAVVTRKGLKVVHIAHFPEMEGRNVIWVCAGDDSVNYININGRLHTNENDSSYDLFMESVKKKLFIKVAKKAFGEGRYNTTCAYENIDCLPKSNDDYQIIEIEVLTSDSNNEEKEIYQNKEEVKI